MLVKGIKRLIRDIDDTLFFTLDHHGNSSTKISSYLMGHLSYAKNAQVIFAVLGIGSGKAQNRGAGADA